MGEVLLQALLAIANVRVLMMLAAGSFVGAIAGALPGVTATTAMAMLAPFAFYLPVLEGIPFLLGVYKGGIWGGAITAILLNIPGTNAAIATCFDGHPLALKGKARKAIDMSLYASVTGETLSGLVVLFAIAPLSAVALKFGPPELLALIVLAISLVGLSAGKSPVKGMASAVIGLGLAAVGMAPLCGSPRFTFGSIHVFSGLSFIPVMIGLFCIPELLAIFRTALRSAGANEKGRKSSEALLQVHREGLTWREYVRCLPAMIRSSGLGIVIGVIPALSQVIAALLAYGIQRRIARNSEEFGQGALEGVAAPEAANNAVNASAMVPMMTFGIPGDLVTAVLLGAFIANGLRPSPTLIREQPIIMYGLLLTMVVGNLVFLAIGKAFMRVFIKAVQTPIKYLVPCISILAIIGAFSVNNSRFDVYVMIVAGLFGYLLKQHDFPVPPLIITFLLGYRLEMYLVQTFVLGRGSLALLLERPVALGILAVGLLVVIWTVLGALKAGRREGVAADPSGASS